MAVVVNGGGETNLYSRRALVGGSLRSGIGLKIDWATVVYDSEPSPMSAKAVRPKAVALRKSYCRSEWEPPVYQLVFTMM